jgi:predicted nuclease of predicted toxin-antitoxin system
VKLLLDFNLSPKLLPLLAGLFPGTTHAQIADLPPESEDIVIWEYAKRENFSILTADRDFLELANRLGQPPKLIRLESMNYRTQQAASILQRNAIRMAEFGKSQAGILILRP